MTIARLLNEYVDFHFKGDNKDLLSATRYLSSFICLTKDRFWAMMKQLHTPKADSSITELSLSLPEDY